MRIALVSPYSFDLPGGVQGQVVGLARAFAARGDAVTVIGPGTDIGAITLPPEVTVSLVGPSVSIPVNGSRAPVALSRAAARATMSALRGCAPDVIHLHEPLVPVTSLWPLRAHLAPTVGTFHRAGATALYRLMRPPASHLVARLDRGAVVSEAARATACAVIGPRARAYALLPNGVDVERFSSAEPWPVEAPTVLFIGRHEERKGLGVLLAAVAELPGDLRVWVVGAGPETRRLRARYDDPRIVWLGRITDDEVARRLAGAQVFVAPSLGGESFGVVLLEAMAAGVRVICSDLDGYRLAADDVATYVPPGDPTALTAALASLLLAERHEPDVPSDEPDADDARRAVARGRARAAEFSFGSLATSYRALYEEAENA